MMRSDISKRMMPDIAESPVSPRRRDTDIRQSHPRNVVSTRRGINNNLICDCHALTSIGNRVFTSSGKIKETVLRANKPRVSTYNEQLTRVEEPVYIAGDLLSSLNPSEFKGVVGALSQTILVDLSNCDTLQLVFFPAPLTNILHFNR